MSPEYRPPSRGEHLMVAMDGFLFAGTLWLVLNVSLVAIAEPLFGTSEPSFAPWVQGVVWFVFNVLPLAAGALVAWVLHGHRVSLLSLAGMGAGLVAGWFAGFAGFVGLASVGRLLVSGSPQTGPPWALIILMGSVIVALLMVPLVESATDLAPKRRRHVLVDALRFACVIAIAIFSLWLAPWLTATYGGEIAEAGLFMLPVAFSGAMAVVGADVLTTLVRRSKERREAGAPASAA